MNTRTAKGFTIEASLRRISGSYPLPDVVAPALQSHASALSRLWLTEGIPYAFASAPALYDALRGWLATRLEVHVKTITLIGSARLGFSLAPNPDYGRPFGNHSDLDLSVVDPQIFERASATFRQWSADYRAGAVRPRNNRQQRFWEGNAELGERTIKRGFIDPTRIIPTLDRYPLAQRVGNLMYQLVVKLSNTDGAPTIARASLSLYRDWDALMNRLATNLRAAGVSLVS